MDRGAAIAGLSLTTPHLQSTTATTVVTDQPEDHVKRIAEFAADAIVAANDTQVDLENPELGFVNIRVGFHSGPVVA